MVRLKTGVLIGAACQLRAVVAGDMGQDTAARRFGEALGVAFQLQDDSAGGGWGQPETLGKAPSDLEERKRGLPVVLAAQEAPEAVATLLAIPGEAATAELLGLLEALAQEEAGEALRALKGLKLRPPWASLFEQLVEFVVARAV